MRRRQLHFSNISLDALLLVVDNGVRSIVRSTYEYTTTHSSLPAGITMEDHGSSGRRSGRQTRACLSARLLFHANDFMIVSVIVRVTAETGTKRALAIARLSIIAGNHLSGSGALKTRGVVEEMMC